MTGHIRKTWRCTLECDGQTWHGTGATPETASAEALYMESTDAGKEITFGEATQHLAVCVANLQAWRESNVRAGGPPPDLVAAVRDAIDRLRRCYADRYGDSK